MVDKGEQAVRDPWADFIRESLTGRIQHDAGYCSLRLGYSPTDEQVAAAVDKYVGTAVEALVEALDHFEGYVWTELEREEEGD